MMPILGSPWLLVGLLAVPLLAGIYLFQRRFRSREVASLLLWEAIGEASLGGRTREPLRLPLPFWLELGAIVLLVFGAAGPLVARWRSSRPLVIVLDDSLSMSAGGAQTARARALDLVRDTVTRGDHDPVRVVFAGTTPQLAAGTTLDEQLSGWTCSATAADLDAAIVFATQLSGPKALILVATDHAPPRELQGGTIAWHAFGARRPNAGFVTAARGGGEHDRVLLEVGGFGASRTTLTVSEGARVLHQRELALNSGGRTRVQLDLLQSATGRAIEARLTADDAAFDDRVLLLPQRRPPVRVALAIGNAALRAYVEGALRATARATITESRPDLRITDGAPGNDAWLVAIDARKASTAFTGPYVLDRTHPLATGLELGGVIWGVGARGPLPGDPVLLAGAQPLLAEERASHRLRLRYDPATSNLHRSAAWPALWWNVLAWRAARMPGVHAANVPLGAEVRVTLRDPAAEIAIHPPNEPTRKGTAVGSDVIVAATQPGLWVVQAGGESERFAVNALTPAESDFSAAVRGSWGGWTAGALTANGQQEIAWLLILGALSLLVLHQRVTATAVRT